MLFSYDRKYCCCCCCCCVERDPIPSRRIVIREWRGCCYYCGGGSYRTWERDCLHCPVEYDARIVVVGGWFWVVGVEIVRFLWCLIITIGGDYWYSRAVNDYYYLSPSSLDGANHSPSNGICAMSSYSWDGTNHQSCLVSYVSYTPY